MPKQFSAQELNIMMIDSLFAGALPKEWNAAPKILLEIKVPISVQDGMKKMAKDGYEAELWTGVLLRFILAGITKSAEDGLALLAKKGML